MIFHDFVIDPREHSRPIVVILLRPAVERVVVALRAPKPHSQKHASRRLGPHVRVAMRPIEVGRWHVVRASPRRQQFAYHLVQRASLGKVLPQPAVKHLDAALVEHLFLVAQQVGPQQCPAIGELRPRQQLVDQPGSLVVSSVRHECASFVGSRQHSQDIEKRAADEGGIVRRRRGIHVQRAQLVVNVAVDVIVGCGILPREVGAVLDKRQAYRRLLVEVPHDDRRLTASPALDEPLPFNRDDVVRRFVHCQLSHVAPRAVREEGRHRKLYFFGRFDEHLLGGHDFEANETRSRLVRLRRSGR